MNKFTTTVFLVALICVSCHSFRRSKPALSSRERFWSTHNVITDTTRTGCIRGVVIDAETAEPIPYVTVIISSPPAGDLSNESGEFLISDLHLGRYAVQASHIDHIPEWLPNVEVTEGDTAVISFELMPKTDDVFDIIN